MNQTEPRFQKEKWNLKLLFLQYRDSNFKINYWNFSSMHCIFPYDENYAKPRNKNDSADNL